MTRCLIKKRLNDHAFTMVELMMSIAFSVLLFTGIYGFFGAASQTFSSGVSGQNLQDGVSIIISKITEGENESGVVYRLSTGMSFAVACTSNCAPSPVVQYTCGGAAQNTACNANNPFGEVYYCQDSACAPNDATARWYYLNSTSSSVCYHHPWIGTSSVACQTDEIIYTAPPGATITLRFSPAVVGSPATPSSKVIEIDVALRLNLSSATQIANNRLKFNNGSGSASTFVLLRNHQ